MELLDILIKWINEYDTSQFWFIENDVICCWPTGWERPVAVFVIDGYIIKSLELGVVIRNNLKEEYSVYDPNFFQDLQHSLMIHKAAYTRIIL
jgi:hypothetical protein